MNYLRGLWERERFFRRVEKLGGWCAMTLLWAVGTLAAAGAMWGVFSLAVGPISFRTVLLCTAMFAVIQAGVVLQKRIR